MQREEFEELTGFYPSLPLYDEIEKAYMDSALDKYAFCEAYRENRDGLAERIQRSADIEQYNMREANAKAVEALNKKYTALERQMEALRKELEKEQEWRDSEINADSLSAYASLKTGFFKNPLSEQEAVDLICKEWGFDRDKVKICTEIPLYQVNRHRRMRKKGTFAAPPLYASTDWNFIRFSCGSVTYEMINGELKMA